MKTVSPKHFVWIGFAAVLCGAILFVTAVMVWLSLSKPPGSVAYTNEESPGAASPGSSVRVFFVAGLACEGREQDIPVSAWQISCHSRNLVVTDTSPPSVEIPGASVGAAPLQLIIRVPGWKGSVVTLPPAAENGCIYIQEPVVLSRETADLALAMPIVGTDYDIAEIVWVRSLDEEPLALPLGKNAFVSLNFTAIKKLAPLPTGVYRCVLRGRGGARIQDFDLCRELALPGGKARSANAILSLPPSLPRSYVGLAGFAANPPPALGSTGFFCGITFDLRKNTGELSLAFRPLQNQQSVRYRDLKPRPDTVWPISNLFLEDPVSLAFDCPLSHVDHRMVIFASDGRFTILPQLILPEDERQKKDLLGRMQALIQVQARQGIENPEFFDSQYARLPAKQLPNYDNLLSVDNFARHLARLSRAPTKPIDLGSQITVRQAGPAAWNVHVDSIAGEPAHP